MYPNCMPDTMILNQAVLQIFCSQCCFTIQNAEVGKGRQFSQIFTEFSTKVKVIYTMDTICERNIMITAQAVFNIFCSQCSIGFQWKCRKMVEKRTQLCHDNSDRKERKKKKKNAGSIIFMLIPYIEFQGPISNVS